MKIVSRILWLSRGVVLFAILCIFCFFYIVKNDMEYRGIIVFLGVILLVLFLISLLIYSREMRIPDQLLKENGNLEEYVEIQKGLFRERVIFENLYQIRMGIVQYFYGCFEESNRLFDSVKKFPRKTICPRCYYQALNSLYLGNFDEFYFWSKQLMKCPESKKDDSFEKLKMNLKLFESAFIDKVDCRNEISQLSPSSRIGQIEKNYLLGVNELNMGRIEEAEKIFIEIAAEELDIFYVADAERLLREVCDSKKQEETISNEFVFSDISKEKDVEWLEEEQPKKIPKKVWIILSIIGLLIVGDYASSLFFTKEKSTYDIDGKVVAEIQEGKQLSVFSLDDDQINLTLFSVSEKDNQKRMKKQMTVTGVALLSDSIESNETFADYENKIEKQLVKTERLYRMLKFSLPDSLPYYGVSTNPAVRNLIINHQKVDRVIDFEHDGSEYYIWYFNNLNVSESNVIQME